MWQCMCKVGMTPRRDRRLESGAGSACLSHNSLPSGVLTRPTRLAFVSSKRGISVSHRLAQAPPLRFPLQPHRSGTTLPTQEPSARLIQMVPEPF